MSANTTIAWTDHTWSPWWGCAPISPGCANCYASAMAKRFRGFEYRKGCERQLVKDWRQPLRWNQHLTCDCGVIKPHIENVFCQPCPKCGSGYRPQRVFPSMCDPFDDEVPVEFRQKFADLVEATPNLDWLLLTKRPENAIKWFRSCSNVWLGVSCEDQQRSDERIPVLLSIPAKVRFVSCEPLLGPVEGWFGKQGGWLKGEQVDWVIVGGESGANARPCEISWIETIADQCCVAKVPLFVKQDYGRKPGQQGRIPDNLWQLKQFPKS